MREISKRSFPRRETREQSILNPTAHFDEMFNFLSTVLFPQVEQIQAEYKVLALQYHPDKNDGDKDAEAMFQKLKVSYNPSK